MSSALEVLDERVLDLLDADAEFEQLADGLQSAEGPIWLVEEDCLLLSDIRADRRCRWDERDGLGVVAAPTSRANGMTLDGEGRLIVCEHSTSMLVRMGADGTGADREVLASHYEGRELNSPNDVVVGEDGSIYFTDPPGGRSAMWGVEREPELDFEAVFRWDPATGALGIVSEFEFPNGLCFSPDESLLYVNESLAERIKVLDRLPDGSYGPPRVFAEGVGPREIGAPDGMKCDEHGNVWVTGPHGIWLFEPGGTHIGTIRLPVADRALNLHWGGAGFDWIYVTGSSTLHRVRTRTRGRREPFMR